MEVEDKCTDTKGEGGRRGVDQEYGIDMYTLFYLK